MEIHHQPCRCGSAPWPPCSGIIGKNGQKNPDVIDDMDTPIISHLRTQRNGPGCTLLSAAAVEFLTQAAASTIDDGADMPAFTGIALPDQVRQRFVHRRAIGHSHQVPAPNRLDRRRLGLLAVPLPAPLFY